MLCYLLYAFGCTAIALHLTHVVRASMSIRIYYSRVVVWFWRKTWTRWFVRHKVRDKLMGYAMLC